MISSGLNQLLKKIKRRSSLSPVGETVPLGLHPFLVVLLSFILPYLTSFFVFFHLLPPHDNESLPCGKGIICGTGSKMPCEPHYRMHDYHDSGAARSHFDIVSSPDSPEQIEARGGQRDRRRGSFLLYRAAIGEELLKP